MPAPRPDLERLRAASGEPRTAQRLAEHYTLEVALAARLRAAEAGERASVYTEVYETLFASLPDHPQHRDRTDMRAVGLQQQAAFLCSFLDRKSVFVEIGCGDAALAKLIAPGVCQSIGIDVTPVLVTAEAVAGAFRFVQTDGVTLDLADGSVDLAYSNQLIEHIHPDDVEAQLREVLRILRPGGRYICTTPNRLTGPHDISRYFSYEPQGFHLQEYTYSDLDALFQRVGFRAAQPVVFLAGRALRPSVSAVRAVEWAANRLPMSARAALSTWQRVTNIAGVTMVGIR